MRDQQKGMSGQFVFSTKSQFEKCIEEPPDQWEMDTVEPVDQWEISRASLPNDKDKNGISPLISELLRTSCRRLIWYLWRTSQGRP